MLVTGLSSLQFYLKDTRSKLRWLLQDPVEWEGDVCGLKGKMQCKVLEGVGLKDFEA